MLSRAKSQEQYKKGGQAKPFILNFLNTATYNRSIEDKQEIGGSTDALIMNQIVILIDGIPLYSDKETSVHRYLT